MHSRSLIVVVFGVFCFAMVDDLRAEDYCIYSAGGLQWALDDASANSQNDTIRMVSGTYYGQLSYVSTEPYALRVEGGYSTDCAGRVEEATIIDGNGQWRILGLSITGKSSSITLSRMQFRNGYTADQNGGAAIYLYAAGGASIALEEMVVSSNLGKQAAIQGSLSDADLRIERSTIRDNTCSNINRGCAIDIREGHGYTYSVILRDSLIENNRHSSTGIPVYFMPSAGMVAIQGYGYVEIVGNDFIGNTSYSTCGPYSIDALGPDDSRGEILFERNFVQGNSGYLRAGAGCLAAVNWLRVNRNIVKGNYAYRGNPDGVFNLRLTGYGNRKTTVTENLIVENIVDTSASSSVPMYPGIMIYGGDVEFRNNTVSANLTSTKTTKGAFATSIRLQPVQILQVVPKATVTNSVLANNGDDTAPVGALEIFHRDAVSLSVYPVSVYENALDYYSEGVFQDAPIDAWGNNLSLRRGKWHMTTGTYAPANGSLLIDRAGRRFSLSEFDLFGVEREQGVRPDIGAIESAAYAGLAMASDMYSSSYQCLWATFWNAAKDRQVIHKLAPLSAANMGQVSLTPESVRSVVMVRDLNGNGSDEIAALAVDANGLVEVKVKDGASGELISKMPFESDYHPLWMRVVPDTGFDGSPELAVLGINSEGRLRAQVRDALSGALVSKVHFDSAYQPFAFEVLEDLESSGFPELAVLGRDSEGRVRAQVKDVISGSLVSLAYFDRNYVPAQAAALDLDGNGVSDALAVIGEDVGGIVKAQVKDVTTGTRLATVRFESGYSQEKLISIPDVDGSGTPELAVLQRQGSTVRVQVKDAITGQLVKIVSLPFGYEPRDLIALPDANGNGKSELAYLGEGPVGSYLLVVKDALSGETISSTTLQ